MVEQWLELRGDRLSQTADVRRREHRSAVEGLVEPQRPASEIGQPEPQREEQDQHAAHH
jgi:hypothetical protein